MYENRWLLVYIYKWKQNNCTTRYDSLYICQNIEKPAALKYPTKDNCIVKDNSLTGWHRTNNTDVLLIRPHSPRNICTCLRVLCAAGLFCLSFLPTPCLQAFLWVLQQQYGVWMQQLLKNNNDISITWIKYVRVSIYANTHTHTHIYVCLRVCVSSMDGTEIKNIFVYKCSTTQVKNRYLKKKSLVKYSQWELVELLQPNTPLKYRHLCFVLVFGVSINSLPHIPKHAVIICRHPTAQDDVFRDWHLNVSGIIIALPLPPNHLRRLEERRTWSTPLFSIECNESPPSYTNKI